MECLIATVAAVAAALYAAWRVEKALRQATESVSENKREQRQRAEALHITSAKLEEATRLPLIAYVRGGLEIGARPGYKIRFLVGEIILSYYDEKRGEPRATKITFFRRGKGTHIVIAPTTS